MSRLGCRGLTLVELLVALVLFGIIVTGLYRTLGTSQRIYQAQTQRIDLQQNVRAAEALLTAELRALAATEGDIGVMARDSIQLRAMRTLAFLCRTPPLGPGLVAGPTVATTVLTVPTQPWYGLRDFDAARDSLLVYYEGDETTRSDDGWVVGRITGIASGSCPVRDARSARELTVRLLFGAGQLDRPGAIPNGAPVRAFETVTYLRYRASDGRHYVGQRSLGGLQPILGPVTANGFALGYYDAAGNSTTDRFQVGEIEVVVRGESTQPVRGAGKQGGLGYATDSVVTRVALRNNRRF